MRKGMEPAGPVKRPYRPKERRRRFLLYCEGIKTEPLYFKALVNFLRSPLIEIEIGEEQKDPKGLVELAKARREEARRAARREKDDSLLYDEVWCVFDVDEHARLNDAIQQASALSIDLAISNPCFEVWLLVHFRNQWAYIERAKVRSAVRKLMPGYDKEVDYSLISGKGATAIKRAAAMERRAIENDDSGGNPTTGVWRLVSELCHHANFSPDKL